MSLADIYNLLERIQLQIGCNCRVSVSIPSLYLLQIKVDWLDDDLHLSYTKCISAQEFKYVVDLDHFTNWFIFMALREHKLKTVGEE